MDRLIEVLEATGWVEPDHMVVERLACLAASMPRRAVRALHLLAQGDKDGFSIYHWRGSATEVIKTAFRSSKPQARQLAKDAINYLVARGFLEFRDLLNDQPT